MSRWWQRRSQENDLDREIRSHLDLEAEVQREAGLSEEQAHNASRRALGNTARIKEDTRAMWGWQWVETLGQDLRYAVRVLHRMPGFAAIVILSLALGVGLTSSVFSVLNALLLRPLPVPDPDRVVRLYQHSYGNTSYLNYRDLQARTKTLDSLTAFSWPVAVAFAVPTGQGSPPSEEVWGAVVSANYFDTLGVQPVAGRTFRPDEDRTLGNAPVIVLSDQLWRTRFHGAADVLGREVRINTHAFVVIGVAAPKVPQPDGLFNHQFWVPLTMCREVGIGNRLERRQQTWLRMIGRLKANVTLPQLQAEAAVIAHQVEAAEP